MARRSQLRRQRAGTVINAASKQLPTFAENDCSKTAASAKYQFVLTNSPKVLYDMLNTLTRSGNVAFLGLIGKKDDLEKIKAEDVKKDILGMEREEARLGRQAYTYREDVETKSQYAENEPDLSESELAHLASDIAVLKSRLAATDDELFRLREERRAMDGLLIVIQRRDRLKRYKVWDRITKMSSEELENGLRVCLIIRFMSPSALA